VGKHSARDGQDGRDNPVTGGSPRPPAPGGPGTGRRRRGSAQDTGGFAVLGPRDLAAARPQAHPEHREHGAWGSGGWSGQAMGRPGRSAGGHGPALDPVEEWAEDWAPYDTAELMRTTRAGATAAPGPAQTRITGPGGGRTVPRPRQEFVDAFDAPAPVRTAGGRAPARGGTGDGGTGEGRPDDAGPDGGGPGGDAGPGGAPDAGSGSSSGSGGKGRTLSGIAAAAVVTVLAVVVGGQAASEKEHTAKDAGAGTDADGAPRSTDGAAPRSHQRASASPAASAAPTYDQLMAEQFPLDPKLSLSGTFVTVPGHQAAPGRGKVMKVRVDVEKGLPLDAQLFSDTVYKTLNDRRSWGHGGTMTFERVSTGPADIVITLASPGTTARWCAKSGLDTSVENVSCDSASTPRTMINAYRWAQGAATYGPQLMHAYRQMLINHEVGHRLGHNHVGCPKEGAPAPVMMQQTKFLSLDGGPTCKPNAWPFP
jgi:hypothetical protein